MDDAFARSIPEVLDFFGVDPTKGLSDTQVVHHGRLQGSNVLHEDQRAPFWKLVLKQFDDLLVKILIAAALISFILALINGETGLMAFLEPSVNEAVVTGWLFFRYLVIGAYVGLATVAGFIWWFVYADSGPKLPYTELMNFDTCPTRDTTYPCSIFEDRHPSTVSMTVLVVVEMFNALNNLSENQSLLVIPPWSNLWLVGSIVLTMLLHILILYIRPLSILFSVTPLSWADWMAVLYLSLPVIIVDEVLKFFSRNPSGLRLRLWFRRSDLLPKREVRDK